MPVFQWSACNIDGKIFKGLDFANSQAELTAILFQRQLGLMYCLQKTTNLSSIKINLLTQLNFFHDLRSLLKSGMPLPQILKLFLHQTKSSGLRCVVGYLSYQVQDCGQSFALALDSFKIVFGDLVVAILQAGFNVGNLDQALTATCSYLESSLQMQRELRRAILMPALTFILFIMIAILVFTIIVPHFVVIFNNANLPLDDATKIVLAISDFLRSRQILVLICSVWLVSLLLHLLFKTTRGRLFRDRILLLMPVISKLIKYQNLFSFLQATGILINGGVPIAEAFYKASTSVSNAFLRREALLAAHLIEQGQVVPLAMQQAAPVFFNTEIITMATVGIESGNLGVVLERMSKVYEQRFKNYMHALLALLQPVLILILGLFVALLIFAIYMPIFNMPAMME